MNMERLRGAHATDHRHHLDHSRRTENGDLAKVIEFPTAKSA